jgi:uncharacterized repeat protein (TIGR01451 family)
MRYQNLWRDACICGSIVVIVLLLGPVKSAPALQSQQASSMQPVERLGLQSEGAGQDAPGPQLSVAAQRDPIVILPDAFGAIPSLKDLPAVPFKASSALARAEEPQLPRSSLSGLSGPDAVAQAWVGAVNMPSPIANFDGVSLAAQGGSFAPPDTEGDIGYDPSTGKRYYFQWINISYEAWDVTNPASPSVVVALTAGNALWQAALPASACAGTNDGDPIVLFDEQAHRWFISQFSLGPSGTGPFHQCVAVSQSANPAGAWYVYDYPYRDGITYFNDYPHFGVWPDATYSAYLMTVHEFNAAGNSYLGQSASAFDRAKLLAGDNAAPLVTFASGTSYYGMLPADLDGAPPAAGTPGFFFMASPAGTLQIWEFKPNWTTPANSVFGMGGGHTADYSLSISSYTEACTNFTCDRVPQLGTSKLLDSLGDRLMHRVAFRVLNGGIQTAVLNQTVDVDGTGGSNRTGIRWYEVRRDAAAGTWSVHQQSTYAPGTTDYRWMGSIATDRSGDIALGFSASSSSIFPSIRYVGRLYTDTLSTMPQAEITMTVGLGAQTGLNRWGDYSMMGVDPQDGCTFWYTQEYNGSTGSVPWKTRIGSFKFPTCVSPTTGDLSGAVRDAADNTPINAAAVTALSSLGTSYPTTTSASGSYQLLNLPTGAYTLTASATGFYPSKITGVDVTAGVTTTQNFALTSWPKTDLSLVKTASSSLVAPGSSLAYTLTVTNNGPAVVSSPVTLTDVLPAGYSFGSAAGSGWSCSGTTTIACTRPSLGVSASADLLISGTAPATFGPITNTATVTATIVDLSPGDNTAAAVSTVAPLTDLAITKTGPAHALSGATLVYTLGVSNNGPTAVGPFTATYASPHAITINDNTAATPYPDTVMVSGLPPVQKATVQLLGFSHTFPRDVDAILVGPTGAKSWLMSDPGGTTAVADVNLTFDDAAASSVSCSTGPASGTYKPTNCTDGVGTDIFPAPAPPGPYMESLAQFIGGDPTGTWDLYVRDDAPIDSGSIASGWKLTLAGTYTLTVKDVLPAGVTFNGASGSGWNCTQSSGVVTCTRPTLAPGAAPDIVISATAPATTGVITNTATITSNLSDDLPANNFAQVATTITSLPPVYGVALSPGVAGKSGSPGAGLTYTLAVTNTGNTSDTFTVAVSGNAFTTNAPSDIGPLAPGASAAFDVVVTIPGGATAGAQDTANVKVTSQGNPAQFAASTLTTTVVNTTYGVTITPGGISQSGSPGAALTSTFQVTNTGSARDAFFISVSGNAFVTKAPANIGPLAAGAKAAFDVQAMIPLTATIGTSDTATLTLTSQGDHVTSAGSTLTTKVVPFQLNLPLVFDQY